MTPGFEALASSTGFAPAWGCMAHTFALGSSSASQGSGTPKALSWEQRDSLYSSSEESGTKAGAKRTTSLWLGGNKTSGVVFQVVPSLRISASPQPFGFCELLC